jgi:serine/threonine protein kinase
MSEPTGKYLGRTFGNYRLEQLIGEGGFSEVYLGEQRFLGTPAAIKVLNTRLTRAEFEQFRQEAQTINTLQHPGIVQLFDFGVESDIPYMAMSYAPKGSLRDLYPVGSCLPLATVVSLVNQIAAALQYAHHHRVVHRDVKPENLLIGPDDQILLSDFGIAVVLHNTYSLRTQQLVGTVAYMAPEQLRKKAQPASDQYALGILAYEWVCGAVPFDGSPIEVAVQHLNEPPPSLRRNVPSLPSAVEAVVLKALAKEPGQRFPTIEAFAETLEQASLLDVLEPPPAFVSTPRGEKGLVRRAVRRERRTDGPPRRRVGLVVALVCFLVVASSGWFWFSALHHAPLVAHPISQPTAGGKPAAQPTSQPSRPYPTVTTALGSMTEFPLSTVNGHPVGIGAGPNGAIWFTDPNTNEIGFITPKGGITVFGSVPGVSAPAQIITGPDDNLWFSEFGSDHIGFLTPGGDRFGGYNIATSPPGSMTTGPDGNIWFTEPASNRIGRLSPQGDFKDFPLPTAGSHPLGITVGPDGNLWFTEFLGNRIGRITPTGAIKEFALPGTIGDPYALITGADKHLWIIEPGEGQMLRMTPTGSLQAFRLPFTTDFAGLALGPDGNVWFTDEPAGKIGRITPAGSIKEVAVPTPRSGLGEMVAGPNRTIWFIENRANQIGRLTLDG